MISWNNQNKYYNCLDQLFFRNDIRDYEFIMVEGAGDRHFINSICPNREVKFPNMFLEKNDNSKNFVKNTIEALQHINEIGQLSIAQKKELRLFNIYGIIDHDYAKTNPNRGIPKLLCNNNTTDLETMLCSTQGTLIEDVLANKGYSNAEKEKIQEALFLAYQIGKVKKQLVDWPDYNGFFRFHDVKLKSKDFSKLVEDGVHFNILKLVKKWFFLRTTTTDIDNNFINNLQQKINNKVFNSDTEPLAQEFISIFNSNDTLENKRNRYFLVGDRLANELILDLDAFNVIDASTKTIPLSFNDFITNPPIDIYSVVSGHDYTMMLKLNCPNIKNEFLIKNNDDNNLEEAMVDAYDCDNNFPNTDLHQQMKNAGLI